MSYAKYVFYVLMGIYNTYQQSDKGRLVLLRCRMIYQNENTSVRSVLKIINRVHD